MKNKHLTEQYDKLSKFYAKEIEKLFLKIVSNEPFIFDEENISYIKTINWGECLDNNSFECIVRKIDIQEEFIVVSYYDQNGNLQRPVKIEFEQLLPEDMDNIIGTVYLF